MKVECLKSLDCVGENKTFKNYKHLYEFISVNADKIKTGKIKLEEAALKEIDDWTMIEKINFQRELVGFYDKSVIISKYIKMLNEFEISAIDEQENPYGEEEDNFPRTKVWCIVESIESKETKNGKKYYNITVSGMSNKTIVFKAWIKPEQLTTFAPTNIICLSLDFSLDWGYSLSKNFKFFKVSQK
jgi:glutamate synthase domain-containing protein 1